MAAGSEGKGWSCSQGREGRGCSLPGPSAPRWPLGEWVGEQVGLGKLKDRGLSCGLGITVRSQCGCSLCSSPEAAGRVRQSGLRRPGPPESRLRREGSSHHSCPGPEGGDGPSPSPSRPRSGKAKAPEQPDSLRSLLPAGRASAWTHSPPWDHRGLAPPAPPGALHPLPLPGLAAAGAQAPEASAAPRPAPARAGPRRRSACSASESCCCLRRSLAPLAQPPPPPPPLPSQDNSQYGGARLPLRRCQQVRGHAESAPPH